MPKIVFANRITISPSLWFMITTRGDLPIYVVGSGSKGIIWNYDIFGFDSGRTKQLCDIVADAGIFTFFLHIYFIVSVVLGVLQMYHLRGIMLKEKTQIL